MITPPVAFTRRFYEEEEVTISVCNYCYAVVAESSQEAELERLERQHSCKNQTQAFAA